MIDEKYLAICDNYGYWHVVEQLEDGEIKKLITLTNRELAMNVRDDLNNQILQAKEDSYEEIRAKRDNMSSIGNLDYEV